MLRSYIKDDLIVLGDGRVLTTIAMQVISTVVVSRLKAGTFYPMNKTI